MTTLPTFGKATVTGAFGRALSVLIPNATGAELRAFFGNRVTRAAVLHWRDGRRQPPQWARDIVRDRLGELAALSASIGDARPAVSSPEPLRRYWAKEKGRRLSRP